MCVPLSAAPCPEPRSDRLPSLEGGGVARLILEPLPGGHIGG